MHPGRPSASGSGGISTEQLKRMEANRRRAQAKLKRVAPPGPHTGVQGPPPAKRHAYTTSTASTSKMVSTFPSSSSYDNVRSHPNSAEASSSSSAGNQVQESKWSNPLISHQGSSSSTKTLSLPRTGTLHNELPSSMTSQTGLQQPPFYSKPSTPHLSTLFHNSPPISAPNKATPLNSRIPPFYSKPPLNALHPITSIPDASIKVAAAISRKPSPSLPPHHPPPVKCTQLRDKKKVRVCMVSKTRLEVKVQYDHDLIEIFKKMPTRTYSELLITSYAYMYVPYLQPS